MKENLQMLVRWWKFTKPSKLYFILSFMSSICFRICMYIIQPIFAAKVITNLTIGNYKLAMLNLTYGTIVFLLGYSIHHIKYLVHDKLLRSTYLPFQNMISKKIFLADKVNFKNNSKDRLLYISYQDAWTTANFSDTLTNKIGQLTQVIITTITIAVTNIFVTLIIILMILLNSFIISFIQTKYAKGTKKILEGIDGHYHTMATMLDSRDYIIKESEKKNLINNHLKANENMLNEFRKRQTWSSINDNLYGSWCKLFIFAVTLFMIMLVSKGSLSLEMYLIVVPYITTLIDASNEVLTGFKDLKNTTVNMNRLQVISNFTERDIIKFGNNTVDDILGQIDFIDLYYKPAKGNLNELEDVNFHIQNHETTLIYGKKDSGKRSIFSLLIRDIEQDRGSIYIDGLKTSDYSQKSYFKNIAYTTNKPYILDGTIAEQFKSITSNKKKIAEACAKVGLSFVINKLPQKYESNIQELSTKHKFLLGLARAISTNSNIIAIYEFPSLDQKDEKELTEILNKLHGQHTFIIFSAQDTFAPICDKIVEIESGTVKNIQFVEKTTK